ncbi:MAG: 1-acyl-sn-glycerol-3-phosphate acyltransferase, partial [Stenotrophomonas sp.]|nr:1-acyl-sn-glycerol-3-phosphate acyltransferase [Stenotrophomonas sp.]
GGAPAPGVCESPPGPPSAIGLAAVGTAAVVPPLSWYAGRSAVRAGRRPVSAFRAMLLVALIDVVLLVALLPNADCVVKRAVARNPFMLGTVGAAGYIVNDDGPALVEAGIAAVRGGGCLVIFPEGTRSEPGQPLRLRRGAANIAVRGRLDMTPVRIRCSPPTLEKGRKWYRVPPRRFHVSLEVGEDIPIGTFLDEDAAAGGEALAARLVTDHLTHYFQPCGELPRAGT